MDIQSEFAQLLSCGQDSFDLATAIQLDARDTAEKLAPMMRFFSTLMVNLGTNGTMDDLIAELESQYGSDYTICLLDGDIINLSLSTRDSEAIVLYTDNGVAKSLMLCGRGNVIDVDIDDEVIPTASNSSLWSVYQVTASLATQLQSSTVIARLASLATSKSFSFADVNAILADAGSNIDPDLYRIVSTLKDMPGGVSQMALLNVLKQVYNAYPGSVAREDTIDFDETEYSVKSFNGTVVFDLIASASQLLGQILLVAGGAVAKIIGAGALLACNVIPSIAHALGYYESAVFDDEADQYDYKVPIIQRSVAPENFDADLLSYIRTYRFVKLTYPYFNVYCWTNPGESDVRIAIYLNMFFSASVTKTYTEDGPLHANMTVTDTVIDSSHSVSVRFRVDSDPVAQTPLGGAVLAKNFGFSVESNNGSFTLITDSSDLALRRRVNKSLCLVGYLTRLLDWNAAGLIESYYSGGESVYDGGYAHVSFDEFAVSTMAQAVSQDNSYDYACVIMDNSNEAPTWAQINNYIIPFLRRKLEQQFEHYDLAKLLFGSSYTNRRFFKSVVFSYSPVVNFRKSFVLTPPNYASGSAWKAIALALAAAAAIAVAVVGVKIAVSRALTSMMTTKYINIQKSWDALKGMDQKAPGYKAEKAAYLKAVRRYNVLAKLTGFSTLSAVQGWETGGSTSGLSSSGFSDNEQLQSAINYITGFNPETGDSTSISTIAELITGRSA